MVWALLNRGIFKRCSTFLVVTALGSFFFEYTVETIAHSIFEARNKGVSSNVIANIKKLLCLDTFMPKRLYDTGMMC